MTETASDFPLAASAVRLGYDRKVVIEDITLDVPEGELTMLVGPNGCGKSTLLKALARILAPKAGHVYLAGTDIHQLRTTAVARQLGFLPQRQSVPRGSRCWTWSAGDGSRISGSGPGGRPPTNRPWPLPWR